MKSFRGSNPQVHTGPETAPVPTKVKNRILVASVIVLRKVLPNSKAKLAQG